MKPLDRRTFLRSVLGGVAASVALPPLEAMLGVNGTAWAGGEELPTRFGVWFWGNGIKPDRWVPSTTGSGWSPSVELDGLAGLTDYVSIASGCEIKTATHPHHSGMTGIMTGRKYYQVGTTRDTIVSTFASQSVDQLAADFYSGQTPFRSLELGVTRFRGTDEGTTFQHLSHNGPNSPNPSEYDPVAVYNRLFGVTTDVRVDLARQSVLDHLGEQVIRLHGRLGHSDQVRLEQHLDGIRTLELQLSAERGACGVPDSVSSWPDVDGQEQIEQQNRTMSELLALALACDLTRAFSVQWSTAGSGVVVWQVGATDSMHSMSHNETGDQPTCHAAIGFAMDNLATFLQTLKDTPEGDGNLLDRCSILCTSELSDGQVHSNDEYPIMIAGRGGGRLRSGVHYRSGSKLNTSHAVLTALRGGGVDAASFGADEGYVTSGIGELEA
ncbi:MAG: DUF1552 domain-containing protein [Alphaproteobacteria bacterium]|nr:DUF1552 domain-containing protein [Alphaproteobacteria bacterium]